MAPAYVLLTRTFFDARFMPGGNPTAAVYTGIDVGRTRFFASCFPARSPGFAATSASRYAVAYVDVAAGFELDSAAACASLAASRHSGGIVCCRCGSRCAVPRRHQERTAGHRHIALLADGDFRLCYHLGCIFNARQESGADASSCATRLQKLTRRLRHE